MRQITISARDVVDAAGVVFFYTLLLIAVIGVAIFIGWAICCSLGYTPTVWNVLVSSFIAPSCLALGAGIAYLYDTDWSITIGKPKLPKAEVRK